MKLRGLIALLSAAGGCADVAFGVDRSEVIGGQITTAGEFPGVGALMYDFGGGGPPEFGCTGTLITPTAVLTAAHCLFGAPSVPGFTLALDTGAGPVVVVPGRTAIPHDRFDFVEPGEGLNEFFDIGVLLLDEPITEVEPVLMARPADSTDLVASLAMEIAGYGETGVGDAGVMHDATTELISLNPTEIQVGMGVPQPQNCYGDSGGPGFANLGGARRLIGVVSRSFNGEECTMGGVDTRVDAYLAWIHSKVTDVPCDSGMSPACEPPEPPDPEPEDPGADDGGGCCSTSRGDGTTILLAFVVGVLLFRRSRSRR